MHHEERFCLLVGRIGLGPFHIAFENILEWKEPVRVVVIGVSREDLAHESGQHRQVIGADRFEPQTNISNRVRFPRQVADVVNECIRDKVRRPDAIESAQLVLIHGRHPKDHQIGSGISDQPLQCPHIEIFD